MFFCDIRTRVPQAWHRELHQVVAHLIITNQPDSVRTLVEHSGYQFRWLDKELQLARVRSAIFGTGRDNAAYGTLWKSVEFEHPGFYSMRELRRARAGEVLVERRKMLAVLAGVGCPRDLLLPMADWSLNNVADGLLTREICYGWSHHEYVARTMIDEACSMYNVAQRTEPETLTAVDFEAQINTMWGVQGTVPCAAALGSAAGGEGGGEDGEEEEEQGEEEEWENDDDSEETFTTRIMKAGQLVMEKWPRLPEQELQVSKDKLVIGRRGQFDHRDQIEKDKAITEGEWNAAHPDRMW